MIIYTFNMIIALCPRRNLVDLVNYSFVYNDDVKTMEDTFPTTTKNINLASQITLRTFD